MWYETDRSELVLGQLLCLQSGSSSPILYKCHEMGGNQEWKHKGEVCRKTVIQIIFIATFSCRTKLQYIIWQLGHV